jgi:hypothetical protein
MKHFACAKILTKTGQAVSLTTRQIAIQIFEKSEPIVLAFFIIPEIF